MSEVLGKIQVVDDRALTRFWKKVEPEPTSGCWLWSAYLSAGDRHTGGGYGKFWDGKRVGMAHRVSYEHFVGPVPEGLVLDHLCEVRACVNPRHLQPVSRLVNMHRGVLSLYG